MKHRLFQTLSLFSRLWNIWKHGGYAHETTSSRSYRMAFDEDSDEWFERMERIDKFFPKEDDGPHCESSWNGRVARARITLAVDERIRKKRGLPLL